MELRNAESIIDDVVTTYMSIRDGDDTEWQRGLVALSFSKNVDTNNTPANDTTNTTTLTTESKTTLSATTALYLLETIRNKLIEIRPLMDKFLKRLNEKDPITNQSRYGTQTAQRVQQILNKYQELVTVILHETFGTTDIESSTTGTTINDTAITTNSNITATTNNGSVIEIIKNLASQEEIEQKQREHDEMIRLQQQEEERRANELRIIQEQQRIENEQRQQIEMEREQLIQQARAIREASIRAQQEEIRRDNQWVASISNKKSILGVRTQLDILLQGTRNVISEQQIAIQALCTIFEQMVAHPEEVNFRRIRRDHPVFMNDIGRHPGGKELLIAAGFELGYVDEVPSFVCKEPNIEADLDGWSSWYDLLKETVAVLAEYKNK